MLRPTWGLGILWIDRIAKIALVVVGVLAAWSFCVLWVLGQLMPPNASRETILPTLYSLWSNLPILSIVALAVFFSISWLTMRYTFFWLRWIWKRQT